MEFAAPLVRARLVRRYKRFLADVAFDDGREATAHCPNPGSMAGLAEAGMRVWLMPGGRGKKLGWSWKLVELPQGHWAGIDTAVPNRVVGEALRAGRVAELARYTSVRAEVPYGTRSRVDFLLGGQGLPPAYVEVKNVHLRRTGDWAEFPDCVTARGARHLDDRGGRVGGGHRGVMVSLVQRTDCARLRLAADLDPAYAAAARRAQEAGVEVLCYGTRIDPGGVTLAARLPVEA